MYKQRFVITLVSLGSALEWFGFTLFGMIAPLFVRDMIPQHAWGAALFYPVLMLLSTLIRPVGGFVFGKMGDRQGRIFVLVRTIGLMIIPLTVTALLPTYQMIGPTAVIILAFVFLLQGFSLGGEFPGSAVFLVELAKPGYRGYFGSWIYCGVFTGMLFAAIEMLWLNDALSNEAARTWGWRLSFLVSAAIASIVLFFRRKLHDSTPFHHAKEFGHLDKEPLFDSFHKYRNSLLCGIGLVVLEAFCFNSVILFAGFYFRQVLQFSALEATIIQLITIFVLCLATPLAGRASVHVKSKDMARWSIYTLLVLAFPLYYLVGFKILWLVILVQAILALLLSLYLANLPALLCSLFPTQVRCSGVGTAFNVAVAIFASLGNLTMTLFSHRQASPLWLAAFLVCGALITLASLSRVKTIHSL